MKITARWLASSLGVLALTAGTAVLLSSCSPAQPRPHATIKIDGFSTVYPITNAIAAEFQATQANKQQADGVNVTVDVSGTSGGFRKFCDRGIYKQRRNYGSSENSRISQRHEY